MQVSRQQEQAAEAMAAKYGRCATARQREDGAVLLVGMTDDIEREFVWVDEDGNRVGSGAPIGASTGPASGFRVFIDGKGSTGPVSALEAAQDILKGLRVGAAVRLVVHGQDGAERPATAADMRAIQAELAL